MLQFFLFPGYLWMKLILLFVNKEAWIECGSRPFAFEREAMVRKAALELETRFLTLHRHIHPVLMENGEYAYFMSPLTYQRYSTLVEMHESVRAAHNVPLPTEQEDVFYEQA